MTIEQAKSEIIEMWTKDFGYKSAQLEGLPYTSRNGGIRRSQNAFVLKLDEEYTEIMYKWIKGDLVQMD